LNASARRDTTWARKKREIGGGRGRKISQIFRLGTAWPAVKMRKVTTTRWKRGATCCTREKGNLPLREKEKRRSEDRKRITKEGGQPESRGQDNRTRGKEEVVG